MIKKQISDHSTLNFKEGESFLIDKPLRWSSFKVIHHIRKILNVKIGHAGTLDPLATGLLILCTGKKTKQITTFQDLEKTYTGSILLGKRTESMDLEKPVIEEKETSHITEEDIIRTRDTFLGNIEQIPPMYSAVKVNGKNLYLLARKGKTVERKAREVFIKEFEITKIEMPEIFFKITCSKGTYIRTIADDFGSRLGCGGVLSSLRRTAIGEHHVDNAFSVEEFIQTFDKREVVPEVL